jgi:hypothetical protein
VEADTGKLLVESDTPLDSLPETFAGDITLHIGGDDWSVVRAEPLTKAQFSRSGKLRVELRSLKSVAIVNPREILFSLPTLNDALPLCDGAKADGSEFEMHEDDWRQTEWVDRRFADLIEQELASVRRIHEEHQGPGGMGFRKVHTRSLIAQPLDMSPSTVQAVIDAIAPGGRTRNLRLRGEARCVRDGFAIRVSDSAWLYGCLSKAGGHVLGLSGSGDASTIAKKIGLVLPTVQLIHWPSTRVFS